MYGRGGATIGGACVLVDREIKVNGRQTELMKQAARQ